MLRHALQHPRPTLACFLQRPRSPTSKRNPPTCYLISCEAKGVVYHQATGGATSFWLGVRPGAHMAGGKKTFSGLLNSEEASIQLGWGLLPKSECSRLDIRQGPLPLGNPRSQLRRHCSHVARPCPFLSRPRLLPSLPQSLLSPLSLWAFGLPPIVS